MQAKTPQAAMQTTISHRAPCQRRRTKSSSNVARAQSQSKTGIAGQDRQGSTTALTSARRRVASGDRDAPQAAMAARRSLIASRGRDRTNMTSNHQEQARGRAREPRSSAMIMPVDARW